MENECTCCGSIYEIERHKVPYRDKDSLQCEVCGTNLIRWNGGVEYTAKLIKKRDKRKVDEESDQFFSKADIYDIPIDYLSIYNTRKSDTSYNEIESIVASGLEKECSDFVNTDYHLTSKISETNAVAYILTGVTVREAIEITKEEISFKANIEYSGDQMADKPICGKEIDLFLSGILIKTKNKWEM